ncbi:hypothetical protein EDD21DRAFT_381719 [Dissophora ornata]|nr:hypothetical protein BGZ58_007266 [Dissophora ornata]KAI8598726.1 hypothetical protein EDD21DRAFT_381719 [Dissophora ornata]
MDAVVKNPLQLPEIRAQIARILEPKDAVACAQVCRAWTSDFLASIWRVVDFAVHERFVALDTETIAKNGHHIRIVKNLKELAQLEALLSLSVSRVVSLTMVIQPSLRFRVNSYDLLRQNSASLEFLDLAAVPDSKNLSVPMDVLHSGSKLTVLKLQGVCMSRNSFSALLRGCDALVVVQMYKTSLVSRSSSDIYQHPRVDSLVAPLNQVFHVDDNSPNAQPLLAHFPSLRTWNTFDYGELDVSTPVFKEQATKYCPMLKSFYCPSPGPVVAQLVLHGFERLIELKVKYDHLTIDAIVAILTHHKSIWHLDTFLLQKNILESSDPNPVKDHLQGSGRIMQLIPRICNELITLSFPLHEMDMDEVEKGSWGCKYLMTLHVRVRGLDTKEKIEKAIMLWKTGRNVRKRKWSDIWGGGSNLDEDSDQDVGDPKPDLNPCPSPDLDDDDDDRVEPVSTLEFNSIEARVARHLLKFDILESVWLGTEVFTV